MRVWVLFVFSPFSVLSFLFISLTHEKQQENLNMFELVSRALVDVTLKTCFLIEKQFIVKQQLHSY